MTTKALIIPAAGMGSRMQKQIPKPFLQLGSYSIIEHTMKRFLPLGGLQQVIVVTSEFYLDEAGKIMEEVLPDSVEGWCLRGGATRQDSIFNGLQEVNDSELVIVHDAVRPFVKLKHIQACCEQASRYGAAILGVPANDTIKRIDDHQLVRETPPRKYLWQTQTPQVFQRALLIEAYRKAREKNYLGTDDSSLVEQLGKQVRMVKGDRTNFKITYPLDLQLAQLLIEKEND